MVSSRFLDSLGRIPLTGVGLARRWLNSSQIGRQPLSLNGTASNVWLTAGCAAGVLAVAGLEAVRPGLASLGSLLLLPVLVAAWLGGTWPAVVVSALAVVTRMLGHRMSGVDFGTALSEATMIVVIAITARFAARSLVASHKSEARVREQAYLLRSLADREQIAANVNESALRNLFALSIRLQALSERLGDSESKRRISAAIEDIDNLCTDLRSLVFAGSQD